MNTNFINLFVMYKRIQSMLYLEEKIKYNISTPPEKHIYLSNLQCLKVICIKGKGKKVQKP